MAHFKQLPTKLVFILNYIMQNIEFKLFFKSSKQIFLLIGNTFKWIYKYTKPFWNARDYITQVEKTVNALFEEQYILPSNFFNQNWSVLRMNPLKVCIRKFSIVIQPNLLNNSKKISHLLTCINDQFLKFILFPIKEKMKSIIVKHKTNFKTVYNICFSDLPDLRTSPKMLLCLSFQNRSKLFP